MKKFFATIYATITLLTIIGNIYHFSAKLTASIGTTLTFGTTTLTTTQATTQLLSGALAITSTGTNFTLPMGYRPLMTMKFCIIKDDGTNGYCQIATTGVFTSYATGTFHINIRFPTV